MNRIESCLQDAKHHLLKFINTYKWALLTSVIVGLVVYYQMYSTGVGYADPFPNMDRYYVNQWADQLGRWMLPGLDDVQSGMVSPFLNTLLSLFIYGIANMFLCHLFRLENKFIQIILAALIVVSPNTAISLNNYYMSEAYPLAYLFAILSVLCVHEQVFKEKHCTLVCSIFCLFISLGMYQSYLGVAFALMIMVAITDTLQHRIHRKQLIQYIITAIVGPIIYFLTTKLVLYFSNSQMASLHGASGIGFGSIITNLPNSIAQCYRDFLAYFFQQTDLSQNAFKIIPINYLCFAAIIIVFLYFLLTDKTMKAGVKVLLCLGLAVLPVFANAVDLITSDSSMYLTSIGGMLVLIPVGLSLLMKQVHLIPHGFFIKAAAVVLSVLVCYSCTLQDNADSSVMLHNLNQATELGNRIWSKIEDQYPEDIGNETICIIGIPSRNEELSPSAQFYNNANWYARIGMFWDDWNGSSQSWKALFRNQLGLRVNYCTQDQFVDIVQSTEYQQMAVWPNSGCIEKINDVIVVKLVTDDKTSSWY